MDKLTEILTSDFLNVPNEEMVFEAAMLWLNKCPSRKQSFEKVRLTQVLYIQVHSLEIQQISLIDFSFFFFFLTGS